MLYIKVPPAKLWDEANEVFISVKEQTLQLEHSLVSLSKWESKWCIPFFSKKEKTYEQTIDVDNKELHNMLGRYISGAKGVAGDIGVIVKYKALLLQVGYTSILTGKFGDTKWHHDPYIGLGISIHKNKKRN